MVAQIEIRQLSFRYPDEPHLTLAGINLAIEEGEFVVVCGPSGSGKSTLLRQLKRELKPAGTQSGEILFEGRPLNEYPLSELSGQIGMVMQDPENQIAVDSVMHELVLGMENQGLKTEVMRKRAAEMVPFFGIGPWLHRKTSELSGGQKQILNLASVLLLQPRILLLDEPTAQLDPVTSKEFLQMLHSLNQELGMTIILSEHRLDEVLPLCNRAVFMDQGEILHSATPREVCLDLYQGSAARSRNYIPSITRLALDATNPSAEPEQLPLTVREGRSWAASRTWSKPVQQIVTDKETETRLACENLFFQYERHEPMILKQLSLEIGRGEFLALLGGNGSGKSTLLRIIASVLKPQRGSVKWNTADNKKLSRDEQMSKIGYVAQDPMLYFLHDTVEKELYHAAVRKSSIRVQERISAIASRFGLTSLLHRHPYDLSGGEKQKTVLACVVLAEPELLLLDEPTKGLDPGMKVELGALLLELNKQGKTVMIVTHDVEFAAAYASRCAMMFDGEITSQGEPRHFFSQNYFYTTPVNRVMRAWLPRAVLPEDVIR